MATPDAKPIFIRHVWARNLADEFLVIGSIVDKYPYISMDTEFPGFVFSQKEGEDRTPQNTYKVLKENVAVLKLIQVGLTFTDSDGNLPDLATGNSHIWQFNFSDFDVVSDPQNPVSIKLLRAHGINFEKNRDLGVDSFSFAELMMSSGMVCNEDVSWIVFHGTYDFGLLIKILTQKSLPEQLRDFMAQLKLFFGDHVYDVKCLMMHCDGLYGGLNDVASLLRIAREVGESHQGGSDSLLTCRVFHRIRSSYFRILRLEKYAGRVFGLET